MSFILKSLSTILRLPFVRGKVTISEFAYKYLNPSEPVVEMNVSNLPVTLDLSERELRYIYFGAYEKGEINFLKKWLKPGQVAVDVGANVGYLSATMAGAVGTQGKIYALEPNPSLSNGLKKLAEKSNGVIKFLQVAVTDEDNGENAFVPFFVYPGHSMWSSLSKEIVESPQIINVQAISLSQFFAENQIFKVDFIKIDVEGTEHKVLSGLQKYLEVSGEKPIILCEMCLAILSTRDSSIEQIERLFLRGYEAFKIDTGGSITQIQKAEIENLNCTVNLVFK